MATINLQPVEVCRTMTGGPAYMLSLPEAASQTYKTGAILAIDAAGYIIEAAAAVGTPSGLASCRIAGVAAEPGHNGTAGQYKAKFYVANQDTVFTMNCDTTTAQVDIGRAFLVEKDSGTAGVWKVDKSAATAGDTATNRIVIIQGLDERDSVGDTQGRYQVIFSAAACGLTYTS